MSKNETKNEILSESEEKNLNAFFEKEAFEEGLVNELERLANPKRVHVFVSQPMTGIEHANIMETRINLFNRFVEYLPTLTKSNSYNVSLIQSYKYSSVINADLPTPALEFLGADIVDMAQADYVVMAYGWENSKGCQCEHFIATVYGIDIICETEDGKFVNERADNIDNILPCNSSTEDSKCDNCSFKSKCPPTDCPMNCGYGEGVHCCKDLDAFD